MDENKWLRLHIFQVNTLVSFIVEKKKYSTIVIMKVDDMDGTGRRVRTEAPGPVTVNSIHRADTAIWLYELG